MKKIFTGVVLCTISVVLFTNIVFAGSLEPSAAPAPTMHTLEELYTKMALIYKKTGARFESAINGSAVTDHNTGLVWERDTKEVNKAWADAGSYCANLTIQGYTDWRLPTSAELSGLVDSSYSNPALPDGHLFTNVQLGFYWSSTSYEGDSALALAGSFATGLLAVLTKADPYYSVLCVRP